MSRLFLLGMPGSGKSTVAQGIERFVKEKYGWNTSYDNDYGILCQMYRNQDSYKKPKQFEPSRYGGFTVLDLAVYDEALRELKRQVAELERQTSKDENHLVLIEFARSDYQHAFRVLESDFLKGASFLFLDATIEVCRCRVIQRVHKFKDDKSLSDYFVSSKVFDRYRKSTNSRYFRSSFQEEYGVPEERFSIIANSYPLQKSGREIYRFVDRLIDSPVRL